jgi:Domain of unknown function (DUF5916)/Carbohydrate family 9 binding domain-like
MVQRAFPFGPESALTIPLALALFLALGSRNAAPASRSLSREELNRLIDGPPAPEAPSVMSRDSGGRATIRAVRIDEPLHVDGRLEERVYADVPSIGGFVQQEPHEGRPETETTEVWVFFDAANLYISARLRDSQPDRILANDMRRDSRNVSGNDNFAVILDTFYDRRNGFLFQTNPLGALWDGQVTDEQTTNSDWNTVWTVETARFPQGWTVEMAIPFKSLRYRDGDAQIWGINFRRIVKWKNEWDYLTPIPAAFRWDGIQKLSYAATLVGIETPEKGMNLELKPYASGSVRTDLDAEPAFRNDAAADAGLDAKYGLTKSLTFDFTYHTDFAQVEADETQVNLTRFSLYFPEKREFFLEGQGIFNFGGRDRGPWDGASDAPFLFFSRRIGLNDEQQVPITAGGRLTGRAGPYTLGLLSISTQELAQSGIPNTNFSVFRMKRDIFRRSNIGVIGTYRSQNLDGTGDNGAIGVDGNFSFFQNLNVNTYYAKTETPGRTGRDASYRGAVTYDGDRYGFQAEHLLVDPDFNPEVGFLRREDFRKSSVGARFSPRPKAVPAVRKFDFEGRYDYFESTAGEVQTRLFTVEWRTQLESSDFASVSFSRDYELLTEPFEIIDGTFIRVGGYQFDRLSAGYWFGRQHPVSGWLGADVGAFYGGRRTELSYWGRVDISKHLALEPNVSINWVDIPEGPFTTDLVRLRATYNLSPRSFVAALVQYNSADDALSTNVRFRWEYQPGSDLFVVYSDGRDTLASGFPALASRSFVVKLTRLFRF